MKNDMREYNELSFSEIEQMAKEIHHVLTKNNGITMDEFINRAKNITWRELGVRYYNALLFEDKLRMYFPDEVIDTFQSKHNGTKPKLFNILDDDFIRKNFTRGSEWLAKRFYINYRQILKRAKRINVKILSKTYHEYTPNEDKFILNYYKQKGTKWLSEKLMISRDQARHRYKILKSQDAK